MSWLRLAPSTVVQNAHVELDDGAVVGCAAQRRASSVVQHLGASSILRISGQIFSDLAIYSFLVNARQSQGRRDVR